MIVYSFKQLENKERLRNKPYSVKWNCSSLKNEPKIRVIGIRIECRSNKGFIRETAKLP